MRSFLYSLFHGEPVEPMKPSGASLDEARRRATDNGTFKAPPDTSLVDARLSQLRQQRREIDSTIDALEIERQLITGGAQ